MNYYVKESKKLWAMIGCAIAMFAFTACSTDDNPANDTSGRVMIQMNTDAMYEELGYRNRMISLLQEDQFRLMGTVLVYDEGGSLVTELTDTIEQMAPITFDTGLLPNGTYTFVAFEYLVDSYQQWELQDKEKLSTVKIYKGTKRVYFHRSLGVVSQSVTINGVTESVEMTPKAAGTMIDVIVNRTENLNTDISLSIEKQGIGIYLDPSLSDAERIEYAPEENLSSALLYSDENRYPYFVLTEGDMNTLLFHWHPDENVYWSVWWNQPISLRPGTHLAYFYDDTPQLFYKTYVGPFDSFNAWQQEAKEHPYAIYPLVPYGASKEEAMQCMSSSGVYNYLREIYPDDQYEDLWYPLSSSFIFYLDLLIDNEKGLCQSCYTYGSDDLPLSLVEEEIVKMGYVFVEDKTYDDGTSRIYGSTDGNERVELFQGDGFWEVYFWAPSYFEAKTRRSGNSSPHMFRHQPQREMSTPLCLSGIMSEQEKEWRLPLMK